MLFTLSLKWLRPKLNEWNSKYAVLLLYSDKYHNSLTARYYTKINKAKIYFSHDYCIENIFVIEYDTHTMSTQIKLYNNFDKDICRYKKERFTTLEYFKDGFTLTTSSKNKTKIILYKVNTKLEVRNFFDIHKNIFFFFKFRFVECTSTRTRQLW